MLVFLSPLLHIHSTTLPANFRIPTDLCQCNTIVQTITGKRAKMCVNSTDYPITQPTYVNMSELATMAALKITNSINQHYSQLSLDTLTPVNQSNVFILAQSSAQSDTSSSITATNTSTVTNPATSRSNTKTATNNVNRSMHTNPDLSDVHSAVTGATLSRQTSNDTTQSSLHEYTFDESTQALSASTSGIHHR